MKYAPLVSTLLLALLTPLASADLITGTVLDSNGLPVAGVNIDAIRVSNGNNINIDNDGTNAAGAFSTTIPADVYDLYFFPPAPPGNAHVTLVVRNVLVSGTRNLGTLRLALGSLVRGNVRNVGGAPVGQVDVIMTDLVTGREVPLLVHRTDAFGNFVVAAPKNAIALELDPSGVPLQTLLPRTLEVNAAADVNLGTLTLQPGFVVSGHVQRLTTGLPLANVDLDFKDLATGVTFSPANDNTNTLGNYSVVVPAGTYDIEFAAPAANLLAAAALRNQVVDSHEAFANVALEPGAVVSGTVRSWDGTLQINADIDVYDRFTGEAIPTPGDNTSATGTYSVIVPLRTLRVVYRPPSYTVPLASQVRIAAINANTVLDATLPAWPLPDNYGTGLAGTGGFVPHLSTSGGAARSGNPAFAYELSGGRGASLAIITVSLAPVSRPFLGGTLLVNPSANMSISATTVLGGTVGAAGAGSRRLFFPPEIAQGLDLYAQFRVKDPAGPRGWALSDGLHFKAVQ